MIDRAQGPGVCPTVINGWRAKLDTGDDIAPEGRTFAPHREFQGSFLAAGRDGRTECPQDQR